MGKHIKEHIDLVELLKALLLDSDKVDEKYRGPLQQHAQQEILRIQFHEACEEEQFEEAADFLVQFVECTGRELNDVERDQLREDINADTKMSDFGEPAASAFEEYDLFEAAPQNEQLLDEYSNHPIFHLYGLIEERTGISKEDVAAFTERLLCGYELERVTFPAGPDGKQREPLPDLRPVAGKLGELARSDKTDILIAILLEKYPEALKRVGISLSLSDAAGTEATELFGKKEKQIEWLTKAMFLVQDHPDWSDARIAKAVGKHKSTLSRNQTYRRAAAMARGSKEDRHRGHKTVNPDTGQLDVVAYTKDPDRDD
jgi:hypothetical protein